MEILKEETVSTNAMDQLSQIDDDYSLVLIPYIARLIADAESTDKVRALRTNALMELKSRLAFYKSRGYMERLLCAIARKKADMIMRTSSRSEMEKVMKVHEPHYDGNRFVPDAYSVPEEEMIAWSETSLKAPLSDIGFRRYKELFTQIFPEQAKEIF